MVAVLAGGTGGAKLARGMLDVIGPDGLTVIANTGDDIDIHGVHVSPDPDLVTFWLADVIDERGWGLRGDTFEAMDQLGDPWFRLGDRDLELCARRTERQRAGERPTVAQAAVADAVGVRARVLPMSDDAVRTWVRTGGRWLPFQEFMIRARGAEPEAVELRGVERARPSPEVEAALRDAEVVVIGPSNPVISIGPILALAGVRERLAARDRVVAVSPFVAGRAVKGPTEAFCRMAGLPVGAAAVGTAYAGIADCAIADEEVPGLRTLVTDVRMDSPGARARVARACLEAAGAVSPG